MLRAETRPIHTYNITYLTYTTYKRIFKISPALSFQQSSSSTSAMIQKWSLHTLS